MTLYQPGIPTGTVDLDQDYQNLQNNFQQLDTTFAVDHVAFSVTENNGYHRAVHMVPVSTTSTNPPKNQPINGYTATPGLGQILDAQINDGYDTDEALFFLTGGNKLSQLTSNIVPVNALLGYTYLPGGVILQWGTITTTFNSQTQLVGFPKTFAKNIWNVSVTLSGGTNASSRRTLTVTTTSLSGFTAFLVDNTGGGYDGFYWMAIGQ
jgi:hypothetical protein